MKKGSDNLMYGLAGILNMGDNFCPYSYKDKNKANMNYIKSYLNKTLNMFKWTGTEDVPHPYIELFAQLYGYCVALKIDNKLYITPAVFGGECDEYYLPKSVIVQNPWADKIPGFNGTHFINQDCVLYKNDSNMLGLYRVINRFTSMLVENDISMLNADILARIVAVMSVDNDKSKNEAKKYIDSIIKGDFSVMADLPTLDGLKLQPLADGTNYITQSLIELEQYLKGGLSHELGINYSFNMKREALNSAETNLADEYLIPTIEDMYNCRKIFCEDIKNVFGLEIDVDFNSVWAENKKESAQDNELIEAQIEQLEAETEQTETETENIEDTTPEVESESKGDTQDELESTETEDEDKEDTEEVTDNEN